MRDASLTAYTGAGASASVRARLARAGIRTMACPRDFPAVPGTRLRVARYASRFAAGGWAFDNGVFELYRRGERFEGSVRTQWEVLVDSLAGAVADGLVQAPDWCALPDVVANGRASLRRSLDALADWQDCGLRWALVVQDGMAPETLPWDAPWDVVFVGGSLPWKLATGASWARAAHEHGRLCHIGRVGTVDRVTWARAAGADSIDSSLPLWAAPKLTGFLAALGGNAHGPLWAAERHIP